MAVMIPEKPFGKASPEVAKVFNSLKKIPGETIECRYDMSLGERTQPEFLILVERQWVYLLAVSCISRQDAENVIQGSIFAEEDQPLTPETFKMAATSTIRSFWSLLLEVDGIDTDSLAGVQKVILFPNVSQVILDRIQQLRPFPEYQMWGREYLSSAQLYEALTDRSNIPLEEDLVQRLRFHFDPAVAVPRDFQPQANLRSIDASLTQNLLDIDQERTAKLDLMLPADADAVVNQSNCRLVTGVAGSGKTLVLLYRAILCQRIQENGRVLILTHNKALRFDMEERFQKLGPQVRVDWFHFLKWCRDFVGDFNIIKLGERRKLIAQLSADIESLDGLSTDFIMDELDWLMDNGIQKRELYLKIERVGRGRPLGERQRSGVFDLFRSYRERLDERGLEDWASIPLRLLCSLQRKQLKLPRYDYIFIDEAQFFAPVWFEVVKFALLPNGQLFLAADPTQGFLKRGQSWRAIGVDIVGRSVRLRKSYRCTRRIYTFAARFYRQRLPNDDEDGTNLPDEFALADTLEGTDPEQIHVGSSQDEITRIERECAAFVQRGGRLKANIDYLC